ncbi:type VI secretion system Vgr family protein [Iodobacter ciconiae]|uniref:Type VI secretion system tip protein VgrG n=1 Tax=Iodobacter ciconiae TaxID=2496266 RepID=A0A3S8ZSB7_9NEIS|nr:type VI secretion system Vgr family protein [Iodobacter ciconiae]AZN36358.1 type VI secretion system tip protein VgrG [Iodobacter ciconiae]
MRPDQLLASFAAAFNQDQRLISLQLGDGAAWGEQLLPQHVTGSEGINQAYRYQIDCLSPDGALELKSLLGLPVVLSIENADGEAIERCGVISQAQLLGSDGGFAKYALTVEPPFALLRYRRTSRVFQDLSVPDIVKQVLAEHQEKNPVFASVQTLDFKLSGTHSPRSYCLQYRESDFDFLTRLLAEEGLAWLFNHFPGDSPQVQLLVFDDAFAIAEATDPFVRFHRADATEESDTLTEWQSQRQIGSSSISLASFDYKATSTNESFDESSIDQGDGGQQLQVSFEDYDPQSLYYASDAEGLSHYASLRQQAMDAKKKSFSGSGTLRSLQAGQWFRLEDHPAHEWDSAEQREFAVTELKFTANNNLPADLTQQLSLVAPGLLAGAALAKNTLPYRADFTAQRRGQPIVPAFAHIEHSKPKSFGVQTATVVGPAGSEVHTDEQGRIKIEFHWQRAAEHPEFGANLDDKSSCWVRVSMPSAGAGFGHQFIPRIGQEVLVDFIEGDIDRPIVTGVVHNGSHPVPTFSGAGALPANKTLSGIKTKEHEGGQYGELLFDDTKGEVRTKLSSEHGKTQLNLGYLIHPRTDGKGEPRGEGFELRSDKQGAIRANGLLISTEAKSGASGKQLDRSPAQSQLESALALAQSLGETATNQLADTIETGDGDQTVKPDNSAGSKATTGHLHHHVHASKSFEAGSNTDKDGKSQSKDQAGGQNIILLHGEDGVAITSPQSQTIAAGTNLDLVAQRDSNQTSGRRWIHNVGQHISLFVAGVKDKVALKLIAAKGQLQMQAQSDDIEITADKNTKFTAIKGKGLFNAKQEILLTAGGAYIRIKGGKIELHAPGKVSIKGGSHDWGGPANLDMAPPYLPKAEDKKNWLELNYRYKNMQPVVGAPYTVLFADGTQKQGTLDDKGHAKLEGIPTEGVQEIIYGWDSRDAEPWVKAPANPIFGQKPSSNEEAALLLEQYLEAETEYLEDNYFPDEIEAMLSEKYGAEPLYEQHYDDYLLDGEQQPRVDYSKEHPKDPPVNSGEKP